MLKWKEYTLNDIDFTMHLDTKRHIWEVYFGTLTEGPSMEFTNAKGEAIVRFLEELKRVQKDRTTGKAE